MDGDDADQCQQPPQLGIARGTQGMTGPGQHRHHQQGATDQSGLGQKLQHDVVAVLIQTEQVVGIHRSDMIKISRGEGPPADALQGMRQQHRPRRAPQAETVGHAARTGKQALQRRHGFALRRPDPAGLDHPLHQEIAGDEPAHNHEDPFAGAVAGDPPQPRSQNKRGQQIQPDTARPRHAEHEQQRQRAETGRQRSAGTPPGQVRQTEQPQRRMTGKVVGLRQIAEKCDAGGLRDQHIQRRLQFEKLDDTGQRTQQRADGKTGRDNHAQLFSPAGHHQRPAGHDQQSRPTQVQRTRQRLPEIR